MKRYYVWIAVCFALLLCVMIYIIGKNIVSVTRENEFDEAGSAQQTEDVTNNDNLPSTDNNKKDPYQGEWDPQSN